MQQAVETALTRNPQIAAAIRTALGVRATIGQAYAPYYPTVSLNASYTHAYSEGSNVVAVTSGQNQAVVVGTSRDNSAATVSLQQTLLDFGARKMQVLQNGENYLASLQDLERIRQDVILTVRQQFFAAYVNQTILAIQKQTVAAQGEHVRQAQGFYEVGTKARSEVVSAQANLAQARLNVIKAQAGLDVSWVNLNVAMGLPRDTRYQLLLEPYWNAMPRLDHDRLLACALAQRPELLNLVARLRSTLAQLEGVYCSRYPTISAQAQYGQSGNPSPFFQSYSAGVYLNVNLFDGFLSRYQASQARASAEATAMQIEQTRQQVFQAVESAFIVYFQAWAAIDAARVSVQSAQENYRLATERYKVGLGSNLDFLDATSLLAQAELSMAQAYDQFRNARASLERAVGVYNLEVLPAPQPPIQPDRIPGSTMDPAAPNEMPKPGSGSYPGQASPSSTSPTPTPPTPTPPTPTPPTPTPRIPSAQPPARGPAPPRPGTSPSAPPSPGHPVPGTSQEHRNLESEPT